MASKKTYTVLNTELEAVLARLQDPATDIDEALLLHERGQKIINEMQTYLKTAQNKIQIVSKQTTKKSK